MSGSNVSYVADASKLVTGSQGASAPVAPGGAAVEDQTLSGAIARVKDAAFTRMIYTVSSWAAFMGLMLCAVLWHSVQSGPKPIVIGLSLVIALILLVETILAFTTQRRIASSADWLVQQVPLPSLLRSVADGLSTPAGHKARLQAIEQLVKALRDASSSSAPLAVRRLRARIDPRVRAALDRLIVMSESVLRDTLTARLHFFGTRPSVEDDYPNRVSIHSLTQLLLYSGIIVTLAGLFLAFGGDSLSNLVSNITERRLDLKSFDRVIEGFMVAFGGSAVGYVAYLAGRLQEDLADRSSVELAMLIENELNDAVTAAFAQLAIEQPVMPPGLDAALALVEERIEHMAAQQIGAVHEIVAEFGKVAKSVNETNLSLQQTLAEARAGAQGFRDLLEHGRTSWATAADKWESAVSRFEVATQNVTSQIVTASQGISTSAEATATASATLVRAADEMAVRLRDGANLINVALEAGVKDIVTSSSQQVDLFRESLGQFQTLIEGQVDDFDETHRRIAEGSQLLSSAVRGGNDQVRDVAERIQSTLLQISNAERERTHQLELLTVAMRDGLLALRETVQTLDTNVGRQLSDRLDTLLAEIGGRTAGGQNSSSRRE